LIEAGAQVDGGDVYIRDTVQLEGHELVDEWRHRLAVKTLELCWRFLAEYPDIVARREIQCGTGTYLPRRRPEDSQLNLAHSLESQFNLLRVVDNVSYPAFFEYNGHRYLLKIEKA
jgi:methionyl-tRNA formyltransferase